MLVNSLQGVLPQQLSTTNLSQAKQSFVPTYHLIGAAPISQGAPTRPAYGASNFWLSTITQLQNQVALLSSFIQGISQQRALDGANGVGLLEGAKLASSQVLREYEQLQLEGAFRKQLDQSLAALVSIPGGAQFGASFDTQIAGVLDGVGRSAQGVVFNALKNEARDFLVENLGVSAEQLSFDGIAEQILGGEAGIPVQNGQLGSTGTVVGATPPGGFSKLAGAAAAAYSAYQLFANWGRSSVASGALNGATLGAYIGSVVPGVGTLIGGVAGGLLGGIASLFGGHKHKDQVARDDFRSLLLQSKIIDADYKLTLADGSKFDIGLDGGARYKGVSGDTLHPYDVDFSNPLSGQVVAWLNPLLKVLTQGEVKLQSDFVGYFTNAAISNAGDLNSARNNVLKIYQTAQIPPAQIAQALYQGMQSGALSQQELVAYAGALQGLFGGEAGVGS